MRAEQAVVIGTGTMGPGIAAVFALGGWRATVCGRRRRSVEAALGRARAAAMTVEQLGLRAKGCAGEAAERLTGSTDLESCVAEADFVVESIPEDLEVKKGCFARLDRAARGDAVLVTNTSGLRVSEIASRMGHPERVAGMHWWNPPYLMPLVEVVWGEKTTEDTVRRVAGLARSLGKLPVIVRRDVPGFLANRLQYVLLREAVRLVEDGVASAEDVDLAMRAGPGLRYAALGPLETADFIGLDVVRDVMNYLLPATGTAPGAPALVEELAGSGHLGIKSGQGFYTYSGTSGKDRGTERDAKLASLLKAGFGR